uniref:Uncharacterized protein n=1 Tax=Physcomitrium patens TaxID=3218 RepID=A0A2K1J0P5_PHYPA|nr:hypothetical protein PHYPA_022999 [Physcomitrium patens]
MGQSDAIGLHSLPLGFLGVVGRLGPLHSEGGLSREMM